MEAPNPHDIEDFSRLETLYEGGAAHTYVGDETLAEVIPDPTERRAWFRHAETEGLVGRDERLVPIFQLREVGRGRVEEGRRQRNNKTQRRLNSRAQLLAWVNQTSAGPHQAVNASSFGSSTYGWFAGSTFDWDEVISAATYLKEKGVIQAQITESWSSPSRIDVAMTIQGHECLDRHAGNAMGCVLSLSPSRIKEVPMVEQHHTVYNGPVFYGSVEGNRLAWNNDAVDQSQDKGIVQVASGFESIAEAVTAMLRHSHESGLNAAERKAAFETGESVLAEITQPAPEVKKVSGLMRMLMGFLAPLAAGASQGVSTEVQNWTQTNIKQLSDGLASLAMISGG